MAANDNVIACGSDLGFQELLAACVGLDASNKPTLRLYDSNSVSGSKFFACGTPVDKDNINNAVRSLFTLDANGDIALRVSLL